MVTEMGTIRGRRFGGDLILIRRLPGRVGGFVERLVLTCGSLGQLEG